MVQRFGRTGRKRMGRVVVLLMEGAEQNKLKASRQKSRSILNKLRNTSSFEFYEDNSLMFDREPRLVMEQITIEEYHASQVGGAGEHHGRKRKLKIAASPKKRKGASQKAWIADAAIGDVLRGPWPTLSPFLRGGRDVMKHAVPTATYLVAHSGRSQLFTNVLNFSLSCGWDGAEYIEEHRRASSAASASPSASQKRITDSARKRMSRVYVVDDSDDESASAGDGVGMDVSDREEEEAAPRSEAESLGNISRVASPTNAADEVNAMENEFAALAVCVPLSPQRRGHAGWLRKAGERCCTLQSHHFGPCIYADVENAILVNRNVRGSRRAPRALGLNKRPIDRARRFRLPLLPRRITSSVGVAVEVPTKRLVPQSAATARLSIKKNAPPPMEAVPVQSASLSPSPVQRIASPIVSPIASTTDAAVAETPLADSALLLNASQPSSSKPAAWQSEPRVVNTPISSVKSKVASGVPSARFDLGLDAGSSSSSDENENPGGSDVEMVRAGDSPCGAAVTERSVMRPQSAVADRCAAAAAAPIVDEYDDIDFGDDSFDEAALAALVDSVEHVPSPAVAARAQPPVAVVLDESSEVGLTQLLEATQDSFDVSATSNSPQRDAGPKRLKRTHVNRVDSARAPSLGDNVRRQGRGGSAVSRGGGRRAKKSGTSRDARRGRSGRRAHAGAAAFFEEQAHLSGSDDQGDDADGDELDVDLEGFINDASQLSNSFRASGEVPHSASSTHMMRARHAIESPGGVRHGFERVLQRSGRRGRRGRGGQQSRIIDRVVAQLEDDRAAVVHRGFRCDVCGVKPIRGIRLRCKVCADFDVCNDCANDADVVMEVHSRHEFERWSQPEVESPSQSQRQQSTAMAASSGLNEVQRSRMAENRRRAQEKLAAKKKQRLRALSQVPSQAQSQSQSQAPSQAASHAASQAMSQQAASQAARFDLGLDSSSSSSDGDGDAGASDAAALHQRAASGLKGRSEKQSVSLVLSKPSLSINSLLRSESSVRLEAMPLHCGADIVISQRTVVVVERASNVNNSKKLSPILERLAMLGATAERVVLVVESKASRASSWSGAVESSTIKAASLNAVLEMSQVQLVSSPNQRTTVGIVAGLVQREARAGVALDLPREMIAAVKDGGRFEESLRFLCSCHLGTAAALQRLASIGSIANVVRQRADASSSGACFARYCERKVDARMIGRRIGR